MSYNFIIASSFRKITLLISYIKPKGNMLKKLAIWAEIDEIDDFLVIFHSSKILVQGLTN